MMCFATAFQWQQRVKWVIQLPTQLAQVACWRERSTPDESRNDSCQAWLRLHWHSITQLPNYYTYVDKISLFVLSILGVVDCSEWRKKKVCHAAVMSLIAVRNYLEPVLQLSLFLWCSFLTTLVIFASGYINLCHLHQGFSVIFAHGNLGGFQEGWGNPHVPTSILSCLTCT